MEKTILLNLIEGDAKKARSAWNKGVYTYAYEMVERLDDDVELKQDTIKKTLLNGADDFKQYSWGGCSLIYDGDIAERLCNKTELKLTRNGERRPNAREEWLDTQARALYQAYIVIARLLKTS